MYKVKMTAMQFPIAFQSIILSLCFLLGFLPISRNLYGNIRLIHRGEVSSGASCASGTSNQPTSSTRRVSKHLHRDIRGSPPCYGVYLPDSHVHANRQLTVTKSDYKRIRGTDTIQLAPRTDFRANQLRTCRQISSTTIDSILRKMYYSRPRITSISLDYWFTIEKQFVANF